MKYIFRGHVIFEYDPEKKEVTQQKIHGSIAGFDYCNFIAEDYKLLSKFFDQAYKHKTDQLEEQELKDIKVY